MDFVNRLRPEHLQAFWHFPSKVNFTLVGTFGALLWATAPAREEAEFYRTRLREYRWTLSVSSRRARFLEYAVQMLDASRAMLANVAAKPAFAETVVSTAGVPPASAAIPQHPNSGNTTNTNNPLDPEEGEEEQDPTSPVPSSSPTLSSSPSSPTDSHHQHHHHQPSHPPTFSGFDTDAMDCYPGPHASSERDGGNGSGSYAPARSGSRSPPGKRARQA